MPAERLHGTDVGDCLAILLLCFARDLVQPLLVVLALQLVELIPDMFANYVMFGDPPTKVVIVEPSGLAFLNNNLVDQTNS